MTDNQLPAVEYLWAELVDDDDPGPNSSTTHPDPSDQARARIRLGTLTARTAHAIAATVRAGAGHTLPGLRHAAAAVGHWTAVRYVSDDELRRRMVKKHLDAYIAQREDTRHDIERLGKKVRRLSRDAADFGLTMEERRSLLDLSRNLQHRRNAGAALARIPFDPVAVQPTRTQIRRARSLHAAARFVGVILPASVAAVGLVVAVPLAGLLALPGLAGGAWWLGHHPITLAERPIPAELMLPELAPPAGADTDDMDGEPGPEEVARLNAALAAAGLMNLEKTGGLEINNGPDYSINNGHTLVADLPKGGGKLVKDVIKKTDVIAGELGVPQTRLVIREVPAAEDGHGRRMHVWVADEDPYLAVGHATSPLATAETWDFWSGTPFGQTILAERRTVPTEFGGGFTSHFFSGIMRFGKTGSMRLDVAAGVLDIGVRLYLANGKAGADWKPAAAVAHRFTEGTDENGLDAFEDMLDELVEDMNTRYRDLGELEPHLVPDGRLTPTLARHHGLPILLGVIDELQLYLLAMTPKRRERALDKLKNLLRGGPAAGVFLVVGTQRPDGEEVPTGFRDLFGVRISVRCLDARSSRMSLGDLASDAGADATVLSEDHVGIVVVATGHRWEILSADFMSIEEFAEVCQRGRRLREKAGTLSGDAAGQPRVTEPREVRAVRACLAAMDDLDIDRARVETLAQAIGADGEFEDITKDDLSKLLREVGCGKVTSIGAVDGQTNASGYKRIALERALKAARERS